MAEGARFELADELPHLRFSRPTRTIFTQPLKSTERRGSPQQERALSALEGLHPVAWDVRGVRRSGDTFGYTNISEKTPLGMFRQRGVALGVL